MKEVTSWASAKGLIAATLLILVCSGGLYVVFKRKESLS
jgi:hypothetical protein